MPSGKQEGREGVGLLCSHLNEVALDSGRWSWGQEKTQKKKAVEPGSGISVLTFTSHEPNMCLTC